MRQRTALVSALALLLLLCSPALMSAVWYNVGMLMLRDGLAQTDFAPGAYPVYGALDETPATVRAIQCLHRAVALDEDSLFARWALGHATLAVGDAVTAADALRALTGRMEYNPLLYHDALTAFSYSGQHEDVVALYESAPPLQHTQEISDAVALAYMEGSRGAGEQGGNGALERARGLRPGDLYANYFLWKQAQEAGDVEVAALYSETLAHFPLEAIHPSDERLLDYAAEVIPALLDAGLWGRDKTLNVVSFLVWQHNEATDVEQLLKLLIERYPTEPDWPFYLAELYHRRGELDRAEAAYRQVLAVDSEHAQVHLRLGMVAEAKSQIPYPKSQEQLEAAAGWYGQYHEMSPEDLLGLKSLAEICTALEEAGVEDESCREAAERVMGEQGDKETGRQVEGEIRNSQFAIPNSPAAVLQEALEARTHDRGIVPELLGVPAESVELGPNLVENGGFEKWVDGRPTWWRWLTQFNREPLNAATFAGGADELLSFEGRRAARVDGFWVQRREDKRPARAGFRQWDEIERTVRPITLTTGVPYVFSFHYRTTTAPEDGARVWVSDDPDVFGAHNYGLPATNGTWRHFVAVGWNRSDCEAAIHPLVRSFAPGCVEFDNVQVRPIWLPKGTTVEAGETRFWVTGKGD